MGVLTTLVEAGHGVGDTLAVGTSAGAAVGAAWKTGSSPESIRSLIDRDPTPDEVAAIREIQRRTGRAERLRPLEPGLAVRAWRTGGGIGTALAGLLPAGRYPTAPFGAIGPIGEAPAWPDGLWITATAVEDGSAVYFGRDIHDVPLGEAVEASVAMPGILRPKEIAGRRYIDGGAVSPTHADALVGADVSLAVVSSPMSARSSTLGRFARRRLAAELAALDRADVPYLLVQPSETAREAFAAYGRLDRTSGDAIVAEGSEAMATALA